MCPSKNGLYVPLRSCELCEKKYGKAPYNLALTLDCHRHYCMSDVLSWH